MGGMGEVRLYKGGFRELLPTRGEETAKAIELDVGEDGWAGGEGVGHLLAGEDVAVGAVCVHRRWLWNRLRVGELLEEEGVEFLYGLVDELVHVRVISVFDQVLGLCRDRVGVGGVYLQEVTKVLRDGESVRGNGSVRRVLEGICRSCDAPGPVEPGQVDHGLVRGWVGG